MTLFLLFFFFDFHLVLLKGQAEEEIQHKSVYTHEDDLAMFPVERRILEKVFAGMIIKASFQLRCLPFPGGNSYTFSGRVYIIQPNDLYHSKLIHVTLSDCCLLFIN